MASFVAPYVPAETLQLPAALPVPHATPNVFVVPAHNEQENLPRLLADLEARPVLFPPKSRLIVVDDGSLDATAELVEAYEGPLPVELVRLEQNQGPGAAFRAGFAAALSGSAGEALVVTLEADTTCDLDALPEMLARAAAGAELVLASVHGGGHMVNISAVRRVLSHCASAVMRATLGVRARTVSSFFRVYRASALREAGDRYGETLIRESGFACKAELLAKLTAIGARVEEVPVDVDGSRRVGKSNMRVLPTMLAYWRLMVRQASGWERASA
jgi:dolichol-phosphate mannosyltransferase